MKKIIVHYQETSNYSVELEVPDKFNPEGYDENKLDDMILENADSAVLEDIEGREVTDIHVMTQAIEQVHDLPTGDDEE